MGMNFYNKHYIAVDEHNRITAGWSDGPHPDRDTTGAICINKQGGYQFRLPYSIGFIGDNEFPTTVISEENPVLYHWPHMIPLYKWGNGVAIRRTEEEIAADIAAIPVVEPEPTLDERNRADIDYLAVMMGVEL